MTQNDEAQTGVSLHSLRNALEQAERQVARLDKANIRVFLLGLDQIEQMVSMVGQDHEAICAEAERWETLRMHLDANPEMILNAAAKAGGLVKLRAQNAPAIGPWWYLDTKAAQRSQTRRRRWLTIANVVVAAALAVWGVMTFFPAVTLLTNTATTLDQLIAAQKWPEALATVEKARQPQADDPTLLVWEAVLNEQLGNTAQAQTSLAQAQQKFTGQPAAFWTLVGNARQQVGNLEGAEAAGQQALADAPQDAQVTFLLGTVADARGDTVQAAAYFSRTIALVGDNNAELSVLAKVHMGNLMPHIEPLPNPVPVPIITQTATPSS